MAVRNKLPTSFFMTIALFCSFQLISSANGLVKLYDSMSFEGWFYEATPTEECLNLPSFGHNIASSLKTDQCVFIFNGVDCEGNTIKVPAGEHSDLREFRRSELNFDNAVKSMKACSAGFGGSILYAQFDTRVVDGEGNVEWVRIINYNDICGCRNLPLYTHGKVNAAHNSGNCLKLYAELECLGGSVEIAGGWGPENWNLDQIGFEGITKSISGCGEASTCARLSATVQKFELANATSIPSPEYLQMPSNITYINDGKVQVSENYNSERALEELIEVFRDPNLARMHRVGVSSSVEVESDVGIPYFDKINIASVLSAAYTFGAGSGERFVRNETKNFEVNERIEISPCARYSLNSYVKMIRNFPVEYELTALVTGVSGDRQLLAEEVKGRLEELEYVADHDSYTVIAKGKGSIRATFGIEAVAHGKGSIIEDCQK